MRETTISFMPETDLFLAADPTKKDFPALLLRWEIDQATIHVPDDYAFVEYLLNAVFERLYQPLRHLFSLVGFPCAVGKFLPYPRQPLEHLLQPRNEGVSFF